MTYEEVCQTVVVDVRCPGDQGEEGVGAADGGVGSNNKEGAIAAAADGAVDEDDEIESNDWVSYNPKETPNARGMGNAFP